MYFEYEFPEDNSIIADCEIADDRINMMSKHLFSITFVDKKKQNDFFERIYKFVFDEDIKFKSGRSIIKFEEFDPLKLSKRVNNSYTSGLGKKPVEDYDFKIHDSLDLFLRCKQDKIKISLFDEMIIRLRKELKNYYAR